MRAPTLILASALASAVTLAAASTPAFAQLSGGLGNFNAANQSFQQENSFRGLQQQQTFNNNQSQLNSSVNQMNAAPAYGAGGGYYRPISRQPVSRRPERER